jgi:tetratricopeptide (TPR) repeat protein
MAISSAPSNSRPTFAEAHYNLAGILAQRGRLDEAIAQCQKAVEIQPGLARPGTSGRFDRRKGKGIQWPLNKSASPGPCGSRPLILAAAVVLAYQPAWHAGFIGTTMCTSRTTDCSRPRTD